LLLKYPDYFPNSKLGKAISWFATAIPSLKNQIPNLHFEIQGWKSEFQA